MTVTFVYLFCPVSFLLSILLFFALICTEASGELVSVPCRAAQPASN